MNTVLTDEWLEGLADDLADQGWAVRDEFLPQGLIAQLALDCRERHAQGLLARAAVGRGSGQAIREGVRPDKSVIGPPMPIEFYRHLSDADLTAIIAYLRAQPAVANAVPKSRYNIPLPPSYGPAVKNVKAPPATDKLKYGEYLAQIGHCMECHTPRDDKGAPKTKQLGAGGIEDLVERHGGLLGISGLSADMRALHAAAGVGEHADGAQAVADHQVGIAVAVDIAQGHARPVLGRGAARQRFGRLHDHLHPLLAVPAVQAQPVGQAHPLGQAFGAAEPDAIAQDLTLTDAQLQVLLADDALLHDLDRVAEQRRLEGLAPDLRLQLARAHDQAPARGLKLRRRANGGSGGIFHAAGREKHVAAQEQLRRHLRLSSRVGYDAVRAFR